jgi:glycosyltransferase involved in cell wall biosynthesis
MEKIKVFFDTRMVTHPGIGRYIKGIVQALWRNPDIELILLGDRSAIKKFLNIDGTVVDFNYPIYSIQEQIGFCRIKKIVGNNILHVPHYNIPFLGHFNLVVTLHDLTHIIYPEGASNKFAALYMRFAIKRALSLAKKIICVSLATQESLQKIFNPDNSVVTVIQEGVSTIFSATSDTMSLAKIKAKYRLCDDFILYVGSIRKHKNIDSLINAFLKLTVTMPNLKLVLVGRLPQGPLRTETGVTYLGEVADEDLPGFYRLARVFCNLSLYEGFSLTLLEAQKCGLAVVCSDIPIHRQTAGDAAVFVSATNIDQIREALYNVLANESLKRSLIAKGLENVNKFNWNLAAAKTLDVYKDANCR